MGEMADDFLDDVLDYEDWLWNMQQQYPGVPEDYLGDME